MAKKRMRQKFYSMEELLKLPVGTKLTALRYNGERSRMQIAEGLHGENKFLVYEKGKRKAYQLFDQMSFAASFKVPVPPDKSASWNRRLKIVIRRLEASKLNPGLLEDLKLIQKIGMQTTALINNLAKRMNKNDKKDAASYFFPYSEMYDILDENGDLKPFFNQTNVLKIETKSMWFGEHNEAYKKQIADAIKNHKDLSLSAKTSYDVRFNYEAKTSTAVYSECLKGCSNGGYYFVIDENLTIKAFDNK